MYFIRLFSYLPLWALYLIGDFLYVIAYYVVRYRRDVVMKNLRNSFPEKDEKTLKSIEKQFYKNLADISVETLKALTIRQKTIMRRVQFDSKLVDEIYNKDESVFLMMPHFCNWEWVVVAYSATTDKELRATYQKLRNAFFNKLMLNIRSRFGVIMHEKSRVVKDLLGMKKRHFVMGMAADQRPFLKEQKFWWKFMNQDAAFYTGTELLAKRFNIKVLYVRNKRIRRGHYKVEFVPISMNPRDTGEHEITKKFISLVEEDIRRDPASYLWSHDRWKHKKPTE